MSLRSAVGEALYRLPEGVRHRLPSGLRARVRAGVGPFAPWEAGHALSHPRLVPGEEPGAPDFVGIGVQKAGTTWWFDLLAAHPGVFHRETIHKERHYFARFATDRFGPDEIAGYHDWFPRPAGARTGEWTPDYIYQPWVAPLLAEAAPDARILVIVRDPVERFLSGVAHSGGGSATHLGGILTEALARSQYAASLRQWSGHFPLGQILVLQYERCVVAPAAELARTYSFLGLDDGYRPAALGAVHRARSESKPVLDPDARRRLVEILAPDVRGLATLVPELDLDLWGDVAR